MGDGDLSDAPENPHGQDHECQDRKPDPPILAEQKRYDAGDEDRVPGYVDREPRKEVGQRRDVSVDPLDELAGRVVLVERRIEMEGVPQEIEAQRVGRRPCHRLTNVGCCDGQKLGEDGDSEEEECSPDQLRSWAAGRGDIDELPKNLGIGEAQADGDQDQSGEHRNPTRLGAQIAPQEAEVVAKGKSHLIVIVTGTDDDDVYDQCQKIAETCEKNGSVDTLIAESREEQAHILHIRSEESMTYKAQRAEILDVTVPPASVGDMMDAVDKLAAEYHTKIPMVAHAGDGNFHPHLMLELKDRGVVKEVKKKLYGKAVELGGVISGEHGIGKTKLDELEMCIDPKSLELMRGLKRLFDPNNVLSPDSAIR